MYEAAVTEGQAMSAREVLDMAQACVAPLAEGGVEHAGPHGGQPTRPLLSEREQPGRVAVVRHASSTRWLFSGSNGLCAKFARCEGSRSVNKYDQFCAANRLGQLRSPLDLRKDLHVRIIQTYLQDLCDLRADAVVSPKRIAAGEDERATHGVLVTSSSSTPSGARN